MIPPFLRLALLVRRLPRGRGAVVVLAVVAAALALAGVEALWGWPEALTPERLRP
jgi:hypothetical protein